MASPTPPPSPAPDVDALERALGDPLDPARPLSFAGAVALDEREEFPQESVRALDALRVHDHFVPTAHGGQLDSLERLWELLRAPARRDLTTAVPYALTFVGACPVWLGGDRGQQHHAFGRILRGEAIAAAYNERDHGSDPLATQVRATSLEGGRFQLDGEKWLINNAARCSAFSLFARTREDGGPRGFAWLFIEKDAVEGPLEVLPPARTHGVRGAKIGGFRFGGARVPAQAQLGPEGNGLELINRMVQVTRPVITGLSMGAGDTALRAAMALSEERNVHGASMREIPYVESSLVGAWADLLLCEAVGRCALRALHVAPEQARLRAAAAKSFIPTTVEEVLRELGVVLGPRSYLRDGHFGGVFQKVQRDHPVIALGHISSFLNLATLALQHRVPLRPGEGDAEEAEVDARVKQLTDVSLPLPPFTPDRLVLLSRDWPDEVLSLARDVERLPQLALSADPQVVDAIRSRARLLLHALGAEQDQFRRQERELGPAFSRSAELFERSRRLAVILAGASAVQVWIHSRAALGGFFAEGDWLVLALDRALHRLSLRTLATPRRCLSAARDALAAQFRENRAFSFTGARLG